MGNDRPARTPAKTFLSQDRNRQSQWPSTRVWSRGTPKNIAASVRARLLSLARERGEDFQLALTRYANERLLYRLTQSSHAPRFVLKGAALFTMWTGELHRATRDLDLQEYGGIRIVLVARITTASVRLQVDVGFGDRPGRGIGSMRHVPRDKVSSLIEGQCSQFVGSSSGPALRLAWIWAAVLAAA
jgi:hypothetical protein